MVEGAMRGNNRFEIVRTKKSRPMMTGRKEASARFLRSASDIIERCERLSNETGCWLHFSAQHMFATEPFLHYASPRILKEAKQDVEQITNHFNRTFLTLIAARNADTKEMHKKLLACKKTRRLLKKLLKRRSIPNVKRTRRPGCQETAGTEGARNGSSALGIRDVEGEVEGGRKREGRG
ncbi:hypothetical protein B0H13DRAFT_2299186 [Mycena leptocephala]|nr:hypothetical protein B0H13DRAFT_2299186 [Mycena leptocephala]